MEYGHVEAINQHINNSMYEFNFVLYVLCSSVTLHDPEASSTRQGGHCTQGNVAVLIEFPEIYILGYNESGL